MTAFIRTLLLVTFLFVVLAGINMLGRMATPAIRRYSPGAGAILDFVF